MIKRGVIPSLQLREKNNTFLFYLFLMLLSSFSYKSELDLLMFLFYSFYILSTKFLNNKFVLTTILLSLGITSFYGTIMVLPFFVLIRSLDQDTLKRNFLVELIHRFYCNLSDIGMEVANPPFGSNSDSIVEKLRARFLTNLHVFLEELWACRKIIDLQINARAVFLRDIGINDYPSLVEAQELDPPDRVLKKYIQAVDNYRILLLFCISLIVLMMTGMNGGVAIVFLFLIWMSQVDTGPIVDVTKGGVPIKDGIYKIQSTFGLPLLGSSGIGVTINKILHVPYHVCNAQPLMIGNIKYYPYYQNVVADLVTYGGRSQITIPLTEENVYVNLESEGSRTTYDIGSNWKFSNGILVIPGLTRPGESGSPILAKRGESFILLGLAGRYVGRMGEQPSEFCEQPKEDIKGSNYERYVTHPGSGKTTRIIPDEITSSLIKWPARKVLLTGPTRVVCNEMYKSLRKSHPHFNVSLNTSDSKSTSRFAPIQIAAHKTALSMMSSGIVNPSSYSTIIIDEAHQDDAATYLLRKFGKTLSEGGVRLVEMSATLDGVLSKGSNYNITDIVLRESEFYSKIKEEIDEGNRTMVFIPGTKGRSFREIYSKFKDYNPIVLSRETLATVKDQLINEERKLILTTDISEVGINVPGLKNVFDYQRKFTYLENEGLVYPDTVNINAASKIQRRGRVGRNIEGIYYNAGLPTMERSSAAEYDATVLANGRSWGELNNTPFQLSDKQYQVWLRKDLTPFRIFIEYDQLGIERTTNDKRTMFNDYVRKGNFEFTGCGKLNCKCKGRYRMLDLRDHEYFFK